MGFWLSWSGGKDAALTLQALGSRSIDGLVTTIGEDDERVPIHGVPRRILESQAQALGLRFETVRLPVPCSNETYIARVQAAFEALGITCVAFGDIHLEDIRAWRQSQFEAMGIRTQFPIFGQDPRTLAERAFGLSARVCSVDAVRLDPRFLGRRFDLALLNDLPESVDPMGECGEFHTLVTDIGALKLVDEAPLPTSEVLPDGRHHVLAWNPPDAAGPSGRPG